MKPYLVGIAGLSGSGKTALAARLAKALPAPAALLSLDSYYLPQDHLTPAERERLNFDHPDALDWPLLEQHLQTLLAGEKIEEPRYSFSSHTRMPGSVAVEPLPYLILEGILALFRPEIRTLFDLKVFVSTRDEECLRRRMERDIVERGRTRESVMKQYRETVWPMAQAFVLPSSQFSDTTVSGEEPFEASIAILLDRIAPPRAATA